MFKWQSLVWKIFIYFIVLPSRMFGILKVKRRSNFGQSNRLITPITSFDRSIKNVFWKYDFASERLIWIIMFYNWYFHIVHVINFHCIRQGKSHTPWILFIKSCIFFRFFLIFNKKIKSVHTPTLGKN